MNDLNSHEFPAKGGYQFRMPQIDPAWTNKYAMVGFDASVQEIIRVRLANPAITAKHRLSVDPETVGRELLDFNRKRLGINTASGSPGFFDPSRSPVAVQGAAAGTRLIRRASQISTGIRTIKELLQSGRGPVPHELAETRAATCVQCPLHKKGDLIDYFVKPVADLLRHHIEEARELKLSTSLDNELNVCTACHCPMRTKVHFPLDIILKHIEKPEHDALATQCWIRTEQNHDTP